MLVGPEGRVISVAYGYPLHMYGVIGFLLQIGQPWHGRIYPQLVCAHLANPHRHDDTMGDQLTRMKNASKVTRRVSKMLAMQSPLLALYRTVARVQSRHFSGVGRKYLTSPLRFPSTPRSSSRILLCVKDQSDHNRITTSTTRLQQFHRQFATSQKAMAPQYSGDDFKVSNLYDVKDKGRI